MRKSLLIIVFLCLSLISYSQSHSICVFDLTNRNVESNDANLFSLKHLLTTFGYRYCVTDSVNKAIHSKIILCSSTIDSSSFNSIEKDSLKSFVNNGGILVATNLKDSALYSLFGINDYQYSLNRYRFRWNMNLADKKELYLINDLEEFGFYLGDSSYSSIIGSRSYVCNTCESMAFFEDGGIACTRNKFCNGYAYNLGIAFKDIVLRSQMMQHYEAARAFSNTFEPGYDLIMFWISGIIKRHVPTEVRIHTSFCNTSSTAVITHDVDATTSMNRMDDFASYEKNNNITATYLITTHYVHDELAKDFFNGYEDEIAIISYQFGQEVGSHSVSHVPDFDIQSVVTQGSPGNTKESYQPYYNGALSTGVTVFGEAEVSAHLLESITGKPVRVFRPGYLAYHKKLISTLDSLNYDYSSSASANNVLSEFPFQAHKDLSLNGVLSDIIEFPNTVSDVFKSASSLDESNYLQKAQIWADVALKHKSNFAPCILLIHPNRMFKLASEQLFIRSLGNDVCIKSFYEFADFWKDRNSLDFEIFETTDSLYLKLSTSFLNLSKDYSFVLNSNVTKPYKIIDSTGHEISFNYRILSDSTLLYFQCEHNTRYDLFYYDENKTFETGDVYPNPLTDLSYLDFELMQESNVTIELYSIDGKMIKELLPYSILDIGAYKMPINLVDLEAGVYLLRLKIAEKTFSKKLIKIN